ncbi:MAG: hypothetical protein ACRCZI_12370, partial [Cetobacterium sp.]
ATGTFTILESTLNDKIGMITGSTNSTNWLKVNLTGTNMIFICLNNARPVLVNNKYLPVIGMLNLN